MRPLVGRLIACVVALLVLAAPAQALNPEQALTGTTTSRWYSGSLNQQYGLNCSIIGGSYSEVMTSAIGGYGGTQSVVGVNDQYWASLLVSTPGNPCGSGSAGLQTDVFLPPGTTVDTTRPVRCFYLQRNSNDVTNGWIDGTNETWAMQGVGSGRICPAGVGASTLAPGGSQIGFRPVPSGMMLKIFVPLKSSQALSGGAGQVIDWLIGSTAAFETPGLSRTAAYVFSGISGGTGGNPSVFFSQQPAAKPYWVDGVSNAQANRVELWVNAYTAGKPGYLSYEIRRTDTNALVWDSASAGAAWNGNVAAGNSIIQLIPAGEAKGPNGGYSPVYFDPPGTPSNPGGEWGVPMRITWTFTPSPGHGSATSASTTFTSLPGPDKDGDGVPDASDVCPNVKGNGANGCAVVVENPSDDGDLDGVPRSADKCPTVQAPGTPDGCPATPVTEQPPVGGGGGAGGGQAPGSGDGAGAGSTAPATGTGPAAAPTPTVGLTTKAKAKLVKSKLVGKRGLALKVQCTPGAAVTVSLTATKATAKLLKLKTNPLPVLASGQATCAGGETSVALTVPKTLASKLKKARVALPATLGASATNGGGTAKAGPVGVRVK